MSSSSAQNGQNIQNTKRQKTRFSKALVGNPDCINPY